jgi:ribosomal protein S12 methylthiotransferase accessory factor
MLHERPQALHNIEVLDITNDLDVPAFVAIGTDDRGGRPYFGSAAHPHPIKGVRKAIAELVQLQFWSTQGTLEPAYEAWLQSASLETDGHLAGDGVIALRDGSTGESVIEMARCLREHGLTAYALNLTRPEVGAAVQRVVVPGARHCWNRRAPGRLYDVPVAMGWRSRPMLETDLNPKCCPL